MWHQDKVARQVDLLTEQSECGLCHCDARVVDQAGNVIAASLFDYEERSKKFDLMDLLVMNSVTGMTSLATKPIAEMACRFPMSGTDEILHDHWLALVAAAQSNVVFLDQVLVDYVQHGANQLGARNRSSARASMHNLLFGGPDYWQRCKRQYAWRKHTLQALSAACKASNSLQTADITGWRGGVRLFSHMVSSWMAGQARQAAQCWRLLAGKLLELG